MPQGPGGYGDGDDEEVDAGDELDQPEEQLKVPDDLGLDWFREREELSDCTVRVPGAEGAEDAGPGGDGEADGGEGEAVPPEPTEFKCHKIVLCSCSSYFFRKMIIEAEQDAASGERPSVELPALPEDDEVRRQVDMQTLFPLVLRYAYSNQDWGSIEKEVNYANAMGLFALAAMLEIKTLTQRAFEFLDATALGPTTVARFLYVTVMLAGRDEAGHLRGAQDRCTEVLCQEFSTVCQNSANLELLCKMPLSVLMPVLESDAINVKSEGEVLTLVTRLLRNRMKREEALLTISNPRLSEAASVMQELLRAPEGVVWEALVVEDVPPTGLRSTIPCAPEVPKYAAASEPMRCAASQGRSEVSIGTEPLRLLIPTAAVGPGLPGSVVFRAQAAGLDGIREVVFSGLLPTGNLPAVSDLGEDGDARQEEGGEEGEEAGGVSEFSAEMYTPAMVHAGVLRFTWKLEPKPDIDDAEQAEGADNGGEEGGEEGNDGIGDATSRQGPFSPDHAATVLQAIRFQHLAHEELMAAGQDEVLRDAGAQMLVLKALSSRLDRYEHITAAGDNSLKGPRPSTLGIRGPRPRPRPCSPKREPEAAVPSPVRPEQPARDRIWPPSDTGISPSVGAVTATADQPVFFQRAGGLGQKDFDENGVLYWLGTCGRTSAWRNPHGLGHVEPLVSAIGFGKKEDLVGRSVVNLRTMNEPESFFGVDLKSDRLLVLQGYCLRNRNATSHTPRSWVFEGSTDGRSWVTLDTRDNDAGMRVAAATAYYEVEDHPDAAPGSLGGAYRCFRLMQTKKNSSGSDNLVLSGIELYGYAVRGSWP